MTEHERERLGTERLASLIRELCPDDGYHPTLIEGFYLNRWSTKDVPRTSLEKAVLCVVAQGAKSTLANGQRLVYDPNKFLLVSLDLPLVGQIERASSAEPFLGVSLVLAFDQIRTLMSELQLPEESERTSLHSLRVGSMDEELLDAIVRLARMLKHPEQIPVLAPLVQREIYYRLLISEQGGALRRIASDLGHVHRVAKGLAWIRRHYREPVSMQEVAREMGMSLSGMYSSVRKVTSMSPLQYQKQLRLHEARRMLLAGGSVVGDVSRRVGYSSVSQFSREYRRLYGFSAKEDVQRLRGGFSDSNRLYLEEVRKS